MISWLLFSCRILQDHTDSSGMHSQALDSLKQKLVEVEEALKREQEAYKQAQVLLPPLLNSLHCWNP